jgi:hypothetical protein
MAGGIAIRIAADFVWLDLNNFALDGSAAGMSTLAKGIFSENHKHITVRNGIVRGFLTGIALEEDSSAGNLTVENIRADRNTRAAISIVAGNAVARRNRITNTGGTTFLNLTGITGLSVSGTSTVIVIDNEVVNTFSSHPQPGNLAYAIVLGGALSIGFNVVAVNNRVTTSTDVGIACNQPPGSQVVLRDSIVVDAPVPYFGVCTFIGTTNYP